MFEISQKFEKIESGFRNLEYCRTCKLWEIPLPMGTRCAKTRNHPNSPNHPLVVVVAVFRSTTNTPRRTTDLHIERMPIAASKTERRRRPREERNMPKPGNRTRSTARAAEKEENVSTVPTILRRFPRLGSSYQTKVLPSVEKSYQPTRRLPVLLSKEFPDVADTDVVDGKVIASGELEVDGWRML